MNLHARPANSHDSLRTSRELRRALLCPQPKREVDGSAPFCAFQSVLVPEAGGVYLIHDLRGILYVGRTINLRQRLAQHYWVTENDLLRLALRHRFGEMRFSWFLVEVGRERALLEHDLVGWLQPPCNRATPGLPR
ncbi:GIY-YIG catalytic domain-containing protein [Methylobacterium sp. 174MFSha1.1]|uniref:GIY-YIG nuclease family protein n=1 Tax=Methylobacterium sp. 174MFSha1.1 TaxID=1502749 RepID=UPI0008E3E4B3|nr:GIY-YIG nuclease family protein [Methylobacterium sp. 174MFSha1.1]SFU78125.1 GIY-YIG catalytic domain-containing protein [Methylobacterium sp. 174MFSha1.1]